MPIVPRRRSTVPTPTSPTFQSTNSPLHSPIRRNPPSRSQSTFLPPNERHQIKKLRKYYLTNLSSKNGSIQDQTIHSAAYYQSETGDFIRLGTSGNQGGRPTTFLLEPPRPNKGPNVPQLLKNFTQSHAMKAIGNMVPIAPNFGYFTIYRETSDSRIHNLASSAAIETITYQTPIPFDNLVVLAGKISSRRSRRSVNSPARTWFMPALWEGLKRLKALQDNTAPVDPRVPLDPTVKDTAIPGLVDGVMRSFGDSLLLFHHKVLKIQRKSDPKMTVSQERRNVVRQEIAERNEDIVKTQANWSSAEQQKAELLRQERLLQEKLSARALSAH